MRALAGRVQAFRPIRAFFCKRATLQKIVIAFLLSYTLAIISFIAVDYLKDRTNYSTYDSIEL